MKLHRLKTLNYCQHAGERTWSFPGSVIGIIGPNASGKSNLVKALEYAITGSLERKRQRILTFGASTGYVELEVELKPGLLATVRRDLHRDRAILSFADGRPAIEGVSKVNQALLELLETDKTLLEQIVFVNQDSIAALLFSPPSEKDRLASRFFGLERAVLIEKALSEEIAAIQLAPPVGSLTTLEQKVLESRNALESAATVRQASALALGDRPQQAPARQERLSRYHLQYQARHARELAVQRLELLSAELVERRDLRDQLAAQVARVPVDRLREYYQREAEVRRRHEERRSWVEAAARIEEDLAELAAKKPAVEAQRAELANREKLEAEASRVQQGLRHEQTLQNTILENQNSEEAGCPICFSQLVSFGEEQLAFIQTDLQAKTDVLNMADSLSATPSRTQQLRRQIEQYERSKRELEERQLLATAGLERSGPDEGPGEPEKWEAYLKQYDTLRESLCGAEQELARVESRLAQLVPVEESAEPLEALEELDVAAEQAWLRETDLLMLESERLRLEEEKFRWENTYAQDELARAQVVAQENARLELRRQRLLKLRRTFHPDGAPCELVGRRVARLESTVNGFLSLLNVKFRAQAAEGFNFEYLYGDDAKNPRSAVELSGGERVAMSIAFRLAALSSFSSSVGLLVLDEPSAAMDAEREALFAELLLSLEPLAEQLGVTFVFVTHATPLLSSFNQVIDLT